MATSEEKTERRWYLTPGVLVMAVVLFLLRAVPMIGEGSDIFSLAGSLTGGLLGAFVLAVAGKWVLQKVSALPSALRS